MIYIVFLFLSIFGFIFSIVLIFLPFGFVFGYIKKIYKKEKNLDLDWILEFMTGLVLTVLLAIGGVVISYYTYNLFFNPVIEYWAYICASGK
jgi:hypothetical protein